MRHKKGNYSRAVTTHRFSVLNELVQAVRSTVGNKVSEILSDNIETIAASDNEDKDVTITIRLSGDLPVEWFEPIKRKVSDISRRDEVIVSPANPLPSPDNNRRVNLSQQRRRAIPNELREMPYCN